MVTVDEAVAISSPWLQIIVEAVISDCKTVTMVMECWTGFDYEELWQQVLLLTSLLQYEVHETQTKINKWSFQNKWQQSRLYKIIGAIATISCTTKFSKISSS